MPTFERLTERMKEKATHRSMNGLASLALLDLGTPRLDTGRDGRGHG